MPIAPQFWGNFALSAIPVTCCACLIALLKSEFRSECTEPSGRIRRALIIACMVASIMAFLASVMYLFRSQARTFFISFFSKWQPLYFIVVSVEKIVLRLTVTITANVSSRRVSCSIFLSEEDAYQIHAILLLWNCTILITALSTISCDLDPRFSPLLRRCSYCFIAFILLVDAIGSFIWGNVMASDVTFSVADIQFLLDNQITSCIYSQVVIAFHLMYVSCRSFQGRGWAYAALRFELDDRFKFPTKKHSREMTSNQCESATATSSLIPMLETETLSSGLHCDSLRKSNRFVRFVERCRQLQKLHVSRCRLFIIPCVVINGVRTEGNPELSLERPAFDLKCLRPLQHLANTHPREYIGFCFTFFAVPSIVCSIILKGQFKGISTLVLNLSCVTMAAGYHSSTKHGLDRVALSHILKSFRFAVLATLLTVRVVLSARLSYYNEIVHPSEYAAVAVGSSLCSAIFFCQCIVLDGSPHLSPSSQILTTVMHFFMCLLNKY